MAMRFILCCSLLGCFACTAPQQEGHFLSNLAVAASDPLYTTYAAPMERSAFALDEAYSLEWYRPEQGLELVADTGGRLGLGFRVKGKWVYRIQDMHEPPQITVSYPDLMACYFYPVAGLRVEARLAVYSSRTVFWDLTLQNETRDSLQVELVPLLYGDYQAFREVSPLPGNAGWSFYHEEYPDSWTISQKVPYVDSLRDYLVWDAPGADLWQGNAWGEEAVRSPFRFDRQQRPAIEVNGRTFTSGGERILKPIQLQVYRPNAPDFLLTEETPVRGLPQPSIDLDGYRRLAIDQLPGAAPGREVIHLAYDPASGEGLMLRDTLQVGKRRVDFPLLPAPNALPPPQSVILTGDTIRWTPVTGAETYRIYARKKNQVVYQQIGMTRGVVYPIPDFPMTETHWIVCAEGKNQQLGMHSAPVNNLERWGLANWLAGDAPPEKVIYPRLLGLVYQQNLAPGSALPVRVLRSVAPAAAPDSLLANQVQEAQQVRWDSLLRANERLFAQVPSLPKANRNTQLLYYSAFNMARQVFYPAEGKSSYNYYVFSREPTWGWGHGGQVFHESLTMPAYALLDPVSAMNSQRVFRERQYDNGYINYRTGAFLDEKIEYEGELTSSAPWYAWINWTLYQQTQDRQFLAEMYPSSSRFYRFYTSRRDQDGDGLCEWGGHAVLESVRDAAVAVWDEVGWPALFEGVDVNCMLVMEAKALEGMALALGKPDEAAAWHADYMRRTRLINQYCWDPETQFYYNVDRRDNDFTYEKPNDLKRKEIIGLLPLWAGVADSLQARALVAEHLHNPREFWRPFGIPSLAANDTFYNSRGYWNGPVWVEWNMLIVEGLLAYGYREEARELVDRVAAGMIQQLQQNHNLWEFYSPDEVWAGYHRTYIWAATINRMLWAVNQ